MTATGWVPRSGRAFQSRLNNASRWLSFPPVSCSSGIGLLTSDPTDNTGAPLGSANSTDTPLVSARTRTRTTVAPLAWSTTRFHTNGTTTLPPALSPVVVSRVSNAVCRAASNKAGWIANPLGSACSGSTTSANNSGPRAHPAVRP